MLNVYTIHSHSDLKISDTYYWAMVQTIYQVSHRFVGRHASFGELPSKVAIRDLGHRLGGGSR